MSIVGWPTARDSLHAAWVGSGRVCFRLSRVPATVEARSVRYTCTVVRIGIAPTAGLLAECATVGSRCAAVSELHGACMDRRGGAQCTRIAKGLPKVLRKLRGGE